MEIRAYEPTDADGLWSCKRGFELGLGEGTGDDAKEAAYREKLTPEYREGWLDWVDRCTADEPRCVTVAVADGEVVGYVFLLPARLAFIWDAAVLNEIYVEPEFRGTGVADDLIEAALDTARDQDLPLDRIVLDVDPANERARAFYDRHGFDDWGDLVARSL